MIQIWEEDVTCISAFIVWRNMRNWRTSVSIFSLCIQLSSRCLSNFKKDQLPFDIGHLGFILPLIQCGDMKDSCFVN